MNALNAPLQNPFSGIAVRRRRRAVSARPGYISIEFDGRDAIGIVLHVVDGGLHSLRRAKRPVGPAPVLTGNGIVEDECAVAIAALPGNADALRARHSRLPGSSKAVRSR